MQIDSNFNSSFSLTKESEAASPSSTPLSAFSSSSLLQQSEPSSSCLTSLCESIKKFVQWIIDCITCKKEEPASKSSKNLLVLQEDGSLDLAGVSQLEDLEFLGENWPGILKSINLSKVLKLNISNCKKLTVAACYGFAAELKRFTHLQELQAAHTYLSVEALQALPETLLRLNISHCKLGPKNLANELSRLRNLQVLDVSHSALSDASGLPVLPASLTQLNIANCMLITTEGLLENLVRYPNLQTLVVTADIAIDRLQLAYPRLTISLQA